MPLPALEIAAILAPILLPRWKDRLNGVDENLLPNGETLITRLADAITGSLDLRSILTDIADIDSVTEKVQKEVESELAKIHRLLPNEGFLDTSILSRVLELLVCPGCGNIDTNLLEHRHPNGDAADHRVFVFDVQSLPEDQIPDSDERFVKALKSWQYACGVVLHMARSAQARGVANVIVKTEPLAGPQGQDLLAMVVPSADGHRAEFTIDKNENWAGREDLFQATITHEIGHVLGLWEPFEQAHAEPHSPSPNDLMFPIVTGRFTMPQDGDIKQAVKIHGQSVFV